MPRDIPVGNGRLLVCFDADYCVRDLYFPHVGQENHLSGNRLRLGVAVDGRFAWVGPGWKRELRYAEDALVTQVSLYHEGMRLLVTCRDAVDFHEDILVRELAVENLEPRARQVRLYMGHDLNISGNSIGDTAAFDPQSGGIVHYKGPRYFLFGAMGPGGTGLAEYAVGVKGVAGKEGAWKDAEDGRLSGNPIAQGSVDSVMGLVLEAPAMGTATAHAWMAAARDWPEVRRLDALVKRKGPATLLDRTAAYWRLWVRKDTPPLELLPESAARLYQRSLLVLATQIDQDGGILAANDSDVIEYNRDTYSYVWPRDGALTANALDAAGFPQPARNFFEFCRRVMTREGYLLHKYNPDGTLASSWHPWWNGGGPQLPIQEDETALVVWALWQHFVQYRDIEFIKPLYRPLVKAAGDFMVDYRDADTGLPRDSWDLWEERRGVLAFTVGAVFGGLTAASLFATVFGEDHKAEAYRAAAAQVRDGASAHLWRPELGRFCRMVSRPVAGQDYAVDDVADSSLWGLFAFGLYAPDDDRIVRTMAALRQRLWVGSGGMARYENDAYYRQQDDVAGNPWFISTLWLADHVIRTARDKAGLAPALELLAWTADHALPSGVLAEQLHPTTGQPLSVSPLTWSHATFVAVCRQLMDKVAVLEGHMPARQDDWIGRLYGQTCDAIHGSCRIR